ncbi:hypothetical protein [Methylomonas sp. YC3]
MVKAIRENASIDWTIKHNVKAKLKARGCCRFTSVTI